MSILLQTKAGKRGKRRGGDLRRTGYERAAPDGQRHGLKAVYADGVRLRHGGGYLHVRRLGGRPRPFLWTARR